MPTRMRFLIARLMDAAPPTDAYLYWRYAGRMRELPAESRPDTHGRKA